MDSIMAGQKKLTDNIFSRLGDIAKNPGQKYIKNMMLIEENTFYSLPAATIGAEDKKTHLIVRLVVEPQLLHDNSYGVKYSLGVLPQGIKGSKGTGVQYQPLQTKFVEKLLKDNTSSILKFLLVDQLNFVRRVASETMPPKFLAGIESGEIDGSVKAGKVVPKKRGGL